MKNVYLYNCSKASLEGCDARIIFHTHYGKIEHRARLTDGPRAQAIATYAWCVTSTDMQPFEWEEALIFCAGKVIAKKVAVELLQGSHDLCVQSTLPGFDPTFFARKL